VLKVLLEVVEPLGGRALWEEVRSSVSPLEVYWDPGPSSLCFFLAPRRWAVLLLQVLSATMYFLATGPKL
jgi:hypothetical protein